MARGVDVHMRETDAFSWSMEGDPRLRMPVVAVAVLDGTPDWDEVATRLERVTRAAPMFRQRVVMPPGRLAPPKWVVDHRFDPAWHIRRMVAPPPATIESLLGFAGQLSAAAFDPMRPLWEVWFVEGLEGARSAFVAKVHHTLTDGVSGMLLLAHLFDVDGHPLADAPVPDPPRPGTTNPVALLGSSLSHDAHQIANVARGSVAALARTMGAARHGPVQALTGALTTWATVLEIIAPNRDRLSPVMTGRGLNHRFGRLDVPIDGLRAAARNVGGTVNDAYLTGVTGGLRRYHEVHGAPVPELRIVLPINTRDSDDLTAGGNGMALIRYLLPLVPEDPVQRMAEVKRRTERWKNAQGMGYIEAVYGAVNTLPTSYLQNLATHNDAVASNVPGFPLPVGFAGPRVLACYPFAPTGGSAVNMTLMSLAGTCHIGVNVDVDAVPDLDVFVTSLRAGFEEVLATAPSATAAVSAAR